MTKSEARGAYSGGAYKKKRVIHFNYKFLDMTKMQEFTNKIIGQKLTKLVNMATLDCQINGGTK